MKILIINDPHFDSIGPISRTDNFLKTEFNKLEEIKDISESENCSYVFFTGDIFDKKAWNRVPTKLIAKLADVFKSFRMPLKSIVGNHDEIGHDPDSVWEQPLGILARASGLEIIVKGKEYNLGDGVYLTGNSFHKDQDLTLDDYVVKRPAKAKFHIHLSHGTLILKKPPFEPFTLYSSLEGKLEMDILANGHLHSDYGIVQQGKTKICNVGSLLRGALTEDNIKRQVGVLFVDTEKNICKKIDLKTAPDISKVFDLKKKEKQEQAEEEIDKLAKLIKQESQEIEVNSLDGIKQLIRESNSIDDKVKECCYQLLDKAEIYT